MVGRLFDGAMSDMAIYQQLCIRPFLLLSLVRASGPYRASQSGAGKKWAPCLSVISPKSKTRAMRRQRSERRTSDYGVSSAGHGTIAVAVGRRHRLQRLRR